MTNVTPWITGWDLENPISIKVSNSAPLLEAKWEAGPTPYFERRSLSLDEAAEGKLGGSHVRGTAAEGEWQADDVDFNMFYVIKGSVQIEFEDGSSHELVADSSAVLPALYRYRFTKISDDFEALHFFAPDAYDIVWGKDTALPERVKTLNPNRSPGISHEEEEAWEDGLREFFEYRDLGTLEKTDGRLYVHVIRTTGQPYEEGTGWHYHSWAQCFFVLDGHADLRVETGARIALSAGDACCIGSGPTNRHFVDRATADYKLVELCVPGWKDATPVEAPEGASR
ncbi:cupin domain-containing protein [Sporosarcina sp. ACRSM]|uniref:cupin domain-containing protein n=1 Tax=Sporosarcina sp. ACRSM TaxID=2918216 RepID=UPI001EF47D7C|nr:cupin domain-containing protein [Sporosarcina sp. ACRSM]MCG7336193.1 cupin domain-containing protein [Sporosarcina sp. ACRSM]